MDPLHGDSVSGSPAPDSVLSEELDRLLERHEMLAAQGRPVSPESLCADRPELLEPLRRCLAALTDFSRFETLSEADADRSLPARIGPYEIVSELARGGSSVIYVARQAFPRRQVALKLLDDFPGRPQRTARFRLEAQLLASLRHPGIASIFDAGVERLAGSERLYFTMELIDGSTVDEHVRARRGAGRWSAHDTIRLCLGYCDALGHAHAAGVVHRDLKPANLLVTREGVPKVIDFGLARVQPEADVSSLDPPSSRAWIGTRSYMSPEQFDSEPATIDARTDIYAMALVLYRLLVGRFPYPVENRSMWETARIVRQQSPRPIGRYDRSLGGDLAVILETALAKEPAERYPTMHDFAEDLRRYLDGRPILARRQNAVRHLWKWCRRHTVAAAVSAIALSLFAALSVVAAVSATLAVRRSGELNRINRELVGREAELRAANRNLQATGDRLRRTAFNRSLHRLGMLVDSEPDYVRAQLDDPRVCPPDLRNGFAWRLVRQAADRTIARWTADRHGLLDVAIADDGTWLATSGPSGLRVWGLPDGRLLTRFLERLDSPGVRLALDSVKRRVLFVRDDGKPGWLETDTGVSHALTRLSSGRPTALACVPGTDRYLIADDSGQLELWTAPGGKRLWGHRPAAAPVIGLTVAGDGDRFAALTRRGDLVVGRIEDGRTLEHQTIESGLRRRQDFVRGRFSPDLRWASCACRAHGSLIWDVAARRSRLSWNFADHFPDSDWLGGQGKEVSFVTSARGSVTIWDDTRRLVTLFSSNRDRGRFAPAPVSDTATDAGAGRVRSDPVAIDASANARCVAIALRGGDVVVSRGGPPSLDRAWQAAKRTVHRLRFSADGRLAATASGSGHVALLDGHSGKLLRQWSSRGKSVRDLRFSHDGRLLLVTDEKRGVTLYDARDGSQLDAVATPPGTRTLLPVGKRWLIGFAESRPQWLRVIESEGGWALEGPQVENFLPIACGAIDPVSGRIIAADAGDNLSLWEPANGDLRQAAHFRLEGVKSVALGRGGTWLMTGTRDGSLGVWETPTLKRLVRKQPNATKVGASALSPDGTVLATGHADGEVLLWDTATWEPQLSLRTELAPIRNLHFSPDGTKLVVAGKGDQLVLLQTGAEG